MAADCLLAMMHGDKSEARAGDDLVGALLLAEFFAAIRSFLAGKK